MLIITIPCEDFLSIKNKEKISISKKATSFWKSRLLKMCDNNIHDITFRTTDFLDVLLMNAKVKIQLLPITQEFIIKIIDIYEYKYKD